MCASVWGIRIRACSRFYRRGFLGGEPPPAGRLARICSVPFLLYEISQLMPLNDKSVRNLLSLPPRGKVDCRSIAKARRMRGKRRYVYYRDSVPLIRQTIYTEPLRRRDEGVPPYRRLRREYVMASFQPIVYDVI